MEKTKDKQGVNLTSPGQILRVLSIATSHCKYTRALTSQIFFFFSLADDASVSLLHDQALVTLRTV